MSETRRILSLWFPRFAAERLIRHTRLAGPVAVVAEAGNMQVLAALSAEAAAAGLCSGQPLRDALALCPTLVTRHADPAAEALFLARLRRWAGKVSPWVAELPPDGLAIDITGCAHLFGDEAGLMAELERDCARLGLSVEMGLADTLGAAWALARFADRAPGRLRSGDDIAQEARATRSKAARRNWVRGGQRPALGVPPTPQARIAALGRTRQALGPLPIAALRLPHETVTALARVGLNRIEDILGMPRAALSRRYGLVLIRRLDQALGLEAEPVSAARPAAHFATRLTFPEPIGLAEDILAGIDRLLPSLAGRLTAAGRGARRLRLQAFRTDHQTDAIDIGLARPSATPADIRPLLAMKVGEIDPGLGIDCLRLEATVVEPLPARQIRGPLAGGETGGNRFDLLLSRIGARIGMEALTRHHPGDSHIPEKAAQALAAAWSEPARNWSGPPAPRPLIIFPPEPVACAEGPAVPDIFRWRRRDFTLASATGPERIAPEWWLDEPAWRSGPRDYWRVETTSGARLWLYYAHGGAVSGGWFCHGEFA